MAQEQTRRKADIITIGGIANEIFNTGDCYTDEEMAEMVLRTLYYRVPDDDGKIHRAMKDLAMGDMRLVLLDMAKTLQPFRYSSPIEVWGCGKGRDAVCSVRVYDPSAKDEIGCTHGAWIAETLGKSHRRFAVVNRLESRRENAGKAALESAMHAMKGMPVYLLAGCLHKGDDELGNRSVIDRLIGYYESLGFRNVNDQYGYEHAAVMMCENK